MYRPVVVLAAVVKILNCVVSWQGYIGSKSIGNRISLICIDALISQYHHLMIFV